MVRKTRMKKKKSNVAGSDSIDVLPECLSLGSCDTLEDIRFKGHLLYLVLEVRN